MSNKTPKANAKKTKSALNKSPFIVGILVVASAIICLTVWGIYSLYFQDEPSDSSQTLVDEPYQTTCLIVGDDPANCEVVMDIADTDATRIKGLSGRESMADDRGMLFVSDNIEIQCFWMQGMLIPLDMIWLDEQKIVTKIEKNVSPDTYPSQFCSEVPDKYVIELTAGSAERLNIALGQTLSF